ncbi:hypothetical protein CXP47_04850 [Pseudomonas chlororaphis]|uniref:Inclusion body protein n=1 Tax=Pseudomonas chlororaphis TaxID=587753 RepID=A0AAP9VWR9_9PSED|nr:hypothetical protein [Pseudomonas chlororaphis]AUG39229.1 hypothetical protein CXP47_04850 [Pseudomonas chlororaphis]QNR48826.1 hypothetical protein HLB40_04805 [Pseudomonas chlororaphis]
MKQIDVLIVVDVDGALSTGSTGGLSQNVYLIDTNKYFGSGAEGQAELQTACTEGQFINWSVTGVSPSSAVQINRFTGQMVNDGVCKPRLVASPAGTYWQGQVEAQGFKGRQQYSVELTVEGTVMNFDPFLNIK